MSLPTASRRSCLRSRLSKVGWVKAIFHRPLEGAAKNITVSRTKGGEHYVSVQCELELAARSRQERRSSTPASCKGPSGGSGACTGSCRGTGRGSSNREKACLLLARQYERVT